MTIRKYATLGIEMMIVLQSQPSTGKMKATAPQVGITAPWQRSAQHALQFTFRTLGTPIIRISSINAMRGSSNFGDMSPQERHAQAAMILACVGRAVDMTEMAYLRAYYGRELFGGKYERAVADILTQTVVGALYTGLHPRRGIQKLIFNYFGKDVPMTKICDDLKCNLYAANKQRNAVYDALSELGARADRDAENALYGAGLIQ
jgi:hypothetical protein